MNTPDPPPSLTTFAVWLDDQQQQALAGMKSSAAAEFAHHADVFDTVTTARRVLFQYEMDTTIAHERTIRAGHLFGTTTNDMKGNQ